MTDAAALSATDRALLQVVYELMAQKGSWPTFTAVDLRADRELGVEDAQAALATVPAQYIFRPWHSHGFYDTDEVRLRLRGVTMCDGGPADLALLENLVAWVVELERNDTGGPEDSLIATAQAFAEHLGITLDPPETEDERTEDSASDEGHEGDPDPNKEQEPQAPDAETSTPGTAAEDTMSNENHESGPETQEKHQSEPPKTQALKSTGSLTSRGFMLRLSFAAARRFAIRPGSDSQARSAVAARCRA